MRPSSAPEAAMALEPWPLAGRGGDLPAGLPPGGRLSPGRLVLRLGHEVGDHPLEQRGQLMQFLR